MTFKPGQWIVVNPNLPYWPNHHKDKLGPFQIKILHESGKKHWYQLGDAPNSVYTEDCTLYKPQVGDKVKILKPMINYSKEHGHLPNTVGQTHIIIEKYTNSLEKAKLRIGEWWYLDEEGVYELVEPQGSINVAAQAPDAVKPQPTKRVLNA